jgi:hypothetical protein
MARAFLILAVVVFLGQATGVLRFVAGDACNQTCSDEQLDSQCAPLCACYTCGARHRPLTLIAQVTLPEQQFLQYLLLQQMSAPISPPPCKIFHVPERLLA